ncbi:protection of telomeres protein 1b-like isoform X2 [Pistacia vera]|uniref:protection of telomeres protein 1b-like isoform X2 n=2 Tax=Pistacia vera TaxID=55513 RepID=UPI00126329CC|nr:protection of telomeres protein 1b-like isoform X2 [Pistacia vera]
MDDRDEYRFLKLNDAVLCINKKVSLIGVILEVGCRKEDQGSDSFYALTIIDESYNEAGIPVNFSTDTVEKLPRIASIGDIILLSNVMMKTDDGQAYALFYKKFSSFALYERKDGEDILPYQVSVRFHPREFDKKLIAGLRKWFHSFQLKEDFLNFTLLKEIKEGQSSNLVCKILHVCEVAKSEWMAFVWDGTDTWPVCIHSKLEDEMEHELPLQLEPFPLSKDILCSFPAVGSILRLIIDKDIEKHILHLLNTFKWVKMLNVHCKVNAGLWCGVLTHFTRLSYLPDEDCLILERQRSFGKRMSMTYPRLPYWCFPWTSGVTELDCNKRVPFVTLMDVLTHSEVTAKYRCMVRVVAAFPYRAEDLRCNRGSYGLRLTLEDPTARIQAFVYAEDGEKLFDGYPSIDIVQRKLNKLLGVVVTDDGMVDNSAPRNPPWVQCCLMSYYIDKNDKWGSRNYRIFMTKIVD